MEAVWTDDAINWLNSLRDGQAAGRISRRIQTFEDVGRVFGDVHTVGGGVSEIRFQFGPGYRLYFAQKGNRLILLLIGGDKSSQERDIRKAQDLLNQLKESKQW